MTFAPFPILFDYVDSIFFLLENSRFLRFSIVGFATFNANFQVWRSFWVLLTLYFFKTHYQTFLQLQMPQLTCNFRICTLDFWFFHKTHKSVFPTFSLVFAKISTFTSQMFHSSKVRYLGFQTHFQPYL